MTTVYTTWGSVRGCCDHKHKSLRTAMTCLEEDQAGCGRYRGGYSDREVRICEREDLPWGPVTHGPGDPVGKGEWAEYCVNEENRWRVNR